MTWWVRPEATQWTCDPPTSDALALHLVLPGYAPTSLAELPDLAAELGVGRVFVKDESARFGLGAFKALGASWAVACLLADRAAQAPPGGPRAQAGAQEAWPSGCGGGAGAWTLGRLRAMAAAAPVELVTATDGNHGRAVAWTARLLGLFAQVFVPGVASSAVIGAIAAQGARVTVAGGGYDDAVRRAAAFAAADPRRVLVQDTAWPGYAAVPARIVEGYETMLAEADEQLREAGVPRPDLVAVPVGVGSLAQAVVTHYRAALPGTGADGTRAAVLSVEPDSAACVLASLRAGQLTSVATASTAMAGLNCGTPSSLCWPVLQAGLDAAVTIPDTAAASAVADLRALGVRSGPSGAAALAGARAALTGEKITCRRRQLGLRTESTVVLLNTEG